MINVTVYVRKPGRRSAKFKTQSQKGIFLGLQPNTTKNILWYDPETNRIKIAAHACFDEGFNDLRIDQIPPNVQHLQRSDLGERLAAEEDKTSVSEFTMYRSPFASTFERQMKIPKTDNSLTKGLVLASDEITNRVYIKEAKPGSTARKMCKEKYEI